MTEFREGQLIVEDEGNGMVLMGLYVDDESISYMDCRLPTESELRQLVPQVYEELDKKDKQISAYKTIDEAMQDRIKQYRAQIKELKHELSLVDKKEIDALYAENERLTNELEKDASDE